MSLGTAPTVPGLKWMLNSSPSVWDASPASLVQQEGAAPACEMSLRRPPMPCGADGARWVGQRVDLFSASIPGRNMNWWQWSVWAQNKEHLCISVSSAYHPAPSAGTYPLSPQPLALGSTWVSCSHPISLSHLEEPDLNKRNMANLSSPEDGTGGVRQ